MRMRMRMMMVVVTGPQAPPLLLLYTSSVRHWCGETSPLRPPTPLLFLFLSLSGACVRACVRISISLSVSLPLYPSLPFEHILFCHNFWFKMWNDVRNFISPLFNEIFFSDYTLIYVYRSPIFNILSILSLFYYQHIVIMGQTQQFPAVTVFSFTTKGLVLPMLGSNDWIYTNLIF